MLEKTTAYLTLSNPRGYAHRVTHVATRTRTHRHKHAHTYTHTRTHAHAHAATPHTCGAMGHTMLLTMMLKTMTGMLFSLHRVMAVSSITFRLSTHTCLQRGLMRERVCVCVCVCVCEYLCLKAKCFGANRETKRKLLHGNGKNKETYL